MSANLPTPLARDEAIQVCAHEAEKAGAAVFVGNGNNARAMAALHDSPHSLYMLGSMGMCASLAAGFAVSAKMPALAIEGDGNALMGMNALPAIADLRPHSFVHVVLDNGIHETTGGQRTLADRVDFVDIALATSYTSAHTVDDQKMLKAALREGLKSPGPSFVHVPTQPTPGPQHVRVPLTPPQIRIRFEQWHSSLRSDRRDDE